MSHSTTPNLAVKADIIANLHYLALYATQIKQDLQAEREPNPYLFIRLKDLADRVSSSCTIPVT